MKKLLIIFSYFTLSLMVGCIEEEISDTPLDCNFGYIIPLTGYYPDADGFLNNYNVKFYAENFSPNLNYIWEHNNKIISTEKEFEYSFSLSNNLPTNNFNVKLTVENRKGELMSCNDKIEVKTLRGDGSLKIGEDQMTLISNSTPYFFSTFPPSSNHPKYTSLDVRYYPNPNSSILKNISLNLSVPLEDLKDIVEIPTMHQTGSIIPRNTSGAPPLSGTFYFEFDTYSTSPTFKTFDDIGGSFSSGVIKYDPERKIIISVDFIFHVKKNKFDEDEEPIPCRISLRHIPISSYYGF